MKFLLLDIDDTISPWLYKRNDAIFIDSIGVELGIPNYIADWLRNSSKNDIKIVWCTSRPPVVCSLIERVIGFKTYGRLSFINPKAYEWNKLYAIIKFCNENVDDIVILADNDIKEGTKGINKLPTNLKLIDPSDSIRGCLSIEDLSIIDSL